MVVVPVPMPEITPVPDPAVAILVLLLLHVPPPASESVVVKPLQINVDPVIAPGEGLTVIVLFAVHPVTGNVYVMTEVPVARPETMPEKLPTVATLVLELVHVPPPASVSEIVELMQTDDEPVIAAGKAFTVTMPVAAQPELSVYEIVAVPTFTPLTVPPDTVAIVVELLLHVPPPVASERMVVPDLHRERDPVNAAGPASTVTVFTAVHPVVGLV